MGDNAKAALLSATTMPRETVHVPELNESYIVQGLSAAGRDRLLKEATAGRGKKARIDMKRLRTLGVARGVVNEDGSRMFSDAEAAQLEKVRSDVVERIFEVFAKLSGLVEMNEEASGDEGEVEGDGGKKE